MDNLTKEKIQKLIDTNPLNSEAITVTCKWSFPLRFSTKTWELGIFLVINLITSAFVIIVNFNQPLYFVSTNPSWINLS